MRSPIRLRWQHRALAKLTSRLGNERVDLDRAAEAGGRNAAGDLDRAVQVGGLEEVEAR